MRCRFPFNRPCRPLLSYLSICSRVWMPYRISPPTETHWKGSNTNAAKASRIEIIVAYCHLEQTKYEKQKGCLENEATETVLWASSSFRSLVPIQKQAPDNLFPVNTHSHKQRFEWFIFLTFHVFPLKWAPTDGREKSFPRPWNRSRVEIFSNFLS